MQFHTVEAFIDHCVTRRTVSPMTDAAYVVCGTTVLYRAHGLHVLNLQFDPIKVSLPPYATEKAFRREMHKVMQYLPQGVKDEV